MAPTEEEEKKAQREKALAKNAAEINKRKEAFAAVLATEPGKEMFKFIFDICGYDQGDLVVNQRTGLIDADGTTFNAIRRGVYLQLRAYAPVEALKQIEYKEETEEKK